MDQIRSLAVASPPSLSNHTQEEEAPAKKKKAEKVKVEKAAKPTKAEKMEPPASKGKAERSASGATAAASGREVSRCPAQPQLTLARVGATERGCPDADGLGVLL